MKLRTALSAAVAIAVFVSVGASGVAGAAPSRRRHHSFREKIEAIAAADKLPAKFTCAKASKELTRISATETRVTAQIATLQTKETAATNAGKTARAHAIAARITAVQTFGTALGTVDTLITNACPSSS
jgi:hypothetical protein